MSAAYDLIVIAGGVIGCCIGHQAAAQVVGAALPALKVAEVVQDTVRHETARSATHVHRIGKMVRCGLRREGLSA